MREKILLIASISFLVGSADHALFVSQSVAESSSPASDGSTFTASIRSTSAHAVAPIRRVLVQMHKEKEEKQVVPPVFKTHYKQRSIQSPFPTHTHQHHYHSPILNAIDKPDIKIQHRLLADEVVKLMPKHCQNVLRNFYVRYEGMEGRGLGGKSTIILNGNVPDDEFRALFVHEWGHLWELGCLEGSSFAQGTRYKDGDYVMKADDPSVEFYRISWVTSNTQRKGTTDADFVSGYASWDMFEDLAESFAYYVLHRSEFELRARDNAVLAAKYAWLEKNLPELPIISISDHKWNGTIPWDITRLPYRWIGDENVASR